MTNVSMHQPPWSKRQLFKSVYLCAGLGLIMGSFEALILSFSLRLHLSVLESLCLLSLCIFIGGLMGAFCGLISGPISWIKRDNDLGCTRLAFSMSLTTLVLSGWLIFPLALELHDKRGAATAFMAAAIPFMFSMVTWYNAFFWFRKTSALGMPKFGWRLICLTLSVIALSISVFTIQLRSFGGKRAILTDPDIILVTISGLRGDAERHMPQLMQASKSCLTMTHTISPMPDTRAAHFGIFTGKNPAMLSLDSKEPRLSAGHQTLTQRLAKEEYATAAFVSNRHLQSESGLERGFQIYDDRFSSILRGADNIQALNAIREFWDWRPEHRNGEQTIDLAMDWMVANNEKPSFVWIHIDDLMPPYFHDGSAFSLSVTSDESSLPAVEQAYRSELSQLDGILSDLLTALSKTKNSNREQILTIVGDRGMGFGGGGNVGANHGLDKALIQTLWINCNSDPDSADGRMSPPVRTIDVFNSVLGQSPHPTSKKSDSADVVALATSEEFKGFSAFLKSRDASGFGTDPIYGYQTVVSNGSRIYKYTYAPVSKVGHLSNPIAIDNRDISEDAPDIRQQLHEHVLAVIGDLEQKGK